MKETTEYKVELKLETKINRSLILNLPLSCTYKLQPELVGTEAKKIQYSLDGGRVWFSGTEFTIPNTNYSFKVRIYDTSGTWTYFMVNKGIEVSHQ